MTLHVFYWNLIDSLKQILHHVHFESHWTSANSGGRHSLIVTTHWTTEYRM